METETAYTQWIDSFRSMYSGKISKWFDVVVLTAADEAQADTFRVLIDDMRTAHRLPDAQYFVLPDPPSSCRIGCGGSTLVVLEFLSRQGIDLAVKRVLLCHAGGFSKRTPHHSVLGKVFAGLPFPVSHGSVPPSRYVSVSTLLEFTLMNFTPVAAAAPPGVFVCCSDVVLLFDPVAVVEAFRAVAGTPAARGVVALGHPSSLRVGSGHGVFVTRVTERSGGPAVVPVDAFIHKPSIDLQKDVFGAECTSVLTDSAFFMGADMVTRLTDAHRSVPSLLDEEVDAYGDFLRPLGSRAGEFGSWLTSRSVAVQSLAAALSAAPPVPFHVVPLGGSAFFHLGTLLEVAGHCGLSEPLARIDGAWRPTTLHDGAFARGATGGSAVTFAGEPLLREAFSAIDGAGAPLRPIDTVAADGVVVGAGSFVERCVLSAGCAVGSRCVLSDVVLPSGGAVVPDGTFLHTTATAGDGVAPVWVTLWCRVTDDIKTLWDVPRFTACDTPAASVAAALRAAGGMVPDAPPRPLKRSRLLSFADVLRGRDMDAVLALRASAVRDTVSPS